MSSFLSKSAREALQRLVELEGEATRPDPLTRLRGIRSLLAELEAEPSTLQSVRDAREAGSSWDDIAEAANLKPAAAKWRWQGTDEDIAARQDAGRKRSARPSSVPNDLPGLSVTDAAAKLGVTAQAIYLRISRGTLRAETTELDDGRKYKRVFLEDDETA